MTREEKIKRLVGVFVPEQAVALIDAFDGPANPNEAEVKVLYYMRGADLATTADQAFTKNGTWASGVITGVFATNASTTPTSATGGIYGGAGKTAPTVVANTQAWSTMTTPQRIVNATLAANQSRVNGSLYLSLTTASTVSATADFYVMGISTNEVI